MKLRDILPSDAAIEAPIADLDVGGVSADSRAIKPGDVFVAIEGGKTDGLNFIGTAIAAGAVAVVAERRPDAPMPAGVVFVRAGNPRRVLALIAAKLYPELAR